MGKSQGLPIENRASKWQQFLQKEYVLPLLLFLISLVLYVPLIAPSVVIGDGGELQMQSRVLGVTYPTGYPLFILLGWIFSHLPLGGDPAFRVTLSCALAAAGAVTLLYLMLTRELRVGKTASVAAALLMVSAPRLWMHAVAAEVYPLNCLFIVICTWLLFRWGHGKTPLWIVTLAFGIGLTHHISLRLFGPGALIYVLMVEPRIFLRPRKWLPALATLLLPLALYLYVPIRAAHFINQPELAGLILGVRKLVASGYISPHYFADGPIGIVLALDYSKLLLSGNLLTLRIFEDFIDMIAWQFPVIVTLPLVLLGMAILFRRDSKANWYLMISYVITVLAGLSFLAIVGEDGDHLIPSYLLMAIWFAVGADALLTWIRRRSHGKSWVHAALSIALLAIPMLNIVRHYPEMTNRRQMDVGPHARQILSQPLQEGAMLAGYWNDITPLRYVQKVEGMRPDIWIVATDAIGIKIVMERAIDERHPYYTIRSTIAGPRLLPLPVWDDDIISNRADQRVTDAVRWRGYEISPDVPQAGDILQITLYWEPDAHVGQDWITFIQLFNEQGEKVAQVDQMPGNELYPPSTWQPGLLLADQYELRLPADLPAGSYQVLFGWYWNSERLEWSDGLDTHTLAEISVQAPKP